MKIDPYFIHPIDPYIQFHPTTDPTPWIQLVFKCSFDGPQICVKQTRKDRYNKKISKYYVEIEEEDQDLSEDEETERTEDVQAIPTTQSNLLCQATQTTVVIPAHVFLQVGNAAKVNFKRLGQRQGKAVPELPEESSDDDAETTESKAKQSNGAEEDSP